MFTVNAIDSVKRMTARVKSILLYPLTECDRSALVIKTMMLSAAHVHPAINMNSRIFMWKSPSCIDYGQIVRLIV